MNWQQRMLTIFFAVAAIFIQAAFLPNFFVPGNIPNLLLLLAVFYTVRFGFEKVWVKLILAGLVLDLATFSWTGLNALALIAAAFSSSFLNRRFLVIHAKWKFIILVILMAAGTLAGEIVLFGVPFLAHQIPDNSSGFELAVILSMLSRKIIFNLVMFVAAYWPLMRLEKFIKAFNRQTL